MKPALIGFFDEDEETVVRSANLPHWRQRAVTYFITFRTSDSIPQSKLKQWETERDVWLQYHMEPYDKHTRKDYYKRFTARIHEWMDQGYGECVLGREPFKSMVEDALKYFHGTRYYLDEFVVMPNHVHVLVTPYEGYELSKILHSWKSFTASEINRALGRKGTFWQKESFDHIVRSEAHLEKIRRYIRAHRAR